MITSKGFKRYFANTSWLFMGRIVRMAVAFFVGVYVARYLGPNNYGLLSYASSFVGLFSVIATLGLSNIVIRELVKDIKKRDSLLGTTFLLKLLGALLAIGIILVAIQFTSNDSFTNLMIFIIAFSMLFQSFNVIDFYFKANVLSKYVVFVNICVLIISSALNLFFIYIKAPLIYFAIVLSGSSFILLVGLIIIYYKQKLNIFSWKFDKTLTFQLLNDSWPMILAGFMGIIHLKIDQVMIKEMMNNAAVGNYAVAAKISEVWYIIPSVITTSLFPAIINAKKISNELYYQRLQKLYDLMALLAVLIAIPVSIFAKEIIQILFGSHYVQASGVLVIHIWAGLAIFVALVRQKWILAENLQKYLIIINICGVFLNVILNLILIPKFGIIGAAFTTLVTYSAGAILIPFFITPVRKSLTMIWLSYMHIFSTCYKIIKAPKNFISTKYESK